MAKRRKKGSGSIYKRNDTWYYENRNQGIFGKAIPGVTNKEKAEEYVAENYSPIVSATDREEFAFRVARLKKFDNQILLDDVWEKFIKASNRKKISEQQLSKYKTRWGKFVKWTKLYSPEALELSLITNEIAFEYARSLWQSNLSPATYNDYLQAMSMIYKTLTGDTENPFALVPKEGRNTLSRKRLYKEERKKLLDWFKKPTKKLNDLPELEVMFYIGAFSGLREKDCALLEWNNPEFGSVDLKRGIIRWKPFKTRKKNVEVIIPIMPELMPMLKKAQFWDEKYVLPKIAKRFQNGGSGVQHACMKVFKETKFSTLYKNTSQRQQQATQYGFHSFRHSFASECAENGIPISQLAKILGADIATLQKYYINISEDAVKSAMRLKQQTPKEKLIARISEQIPSATHAKLKQILQILK